MWKGALVGAIALTTAVTPLAVAEPWEAPQKNQERVASHTRPILQESHITRLRAALNLTPEQQKYWAPVEAALRALARQQAREGVGSGMMQRMSDKASTMAGTAVKLRRLASAAAPLIRVLDDGQKRNAVSFAHSAGFGHLAAAF
jgi:hypothetical protein